MSNFVKIVAISEVRKDKNGREYKAITVQSSNSREVTDPVTGEMFFAVSKPKKSNVIAYAKSYLDDAPHYLYDIPVGTAVHGTIVSKNVTPYTINTKEGDREVTRYTTFVEATETEENYDEIVKRAFENAGHTLAKSIVMPVTQQKSEEESEEVPAKVPVVADSDSFEDEF